MEQNTEHNAPDTGHKGYCMYYLFLFFFLLILTILMLYNRNFVLDFK
jgi:hypothetical protein